MRSIHRLLLFCCAVQFSFVSISAFQSSFIARNGPLLNRKISHRSTSVHSKTQMLVVPELATSYVTALTGWTASVAANLHIPDFFLKYTHPIGLAFSVLTALKGAQMGYLIRSGQGDAMSVANVDKTARELHPLFMVLSALFFVVGAQGGAVLLQVVKPGSELLQSPHAALALTAIPLLGVQALLSTAFKGEMNEKARTAHAYIGGVTVFLLLAVSAAGVKLAFTL